MPDEEKDMYCYACGRHRSEVRRLIGLREDSEDEDTVLVCDECAVLIADVATQGRSSLLGPSDDQAEPGRLRVVFPDHEKDIKSIHLYIDKHGPVLKWSTERAKLNRNLDDHVLMLGITSHMLFSELGRLLGNALHLGPSTRQRSASCTLGKGDGS